MDHAHEITAPLTGSALAPQAPRGPPSSNWLGRAALALVLLPLAVSALALVLDAGTSYIAGSDQGLIELQTSDVGRHPVLVGPYARNGWNHPGPALFYALSVPYRLAGSHSIGLGLGALLIKRPRHFGDGHRRATPRRAPVVAADARG